MDNLHYHLDETLEHRLAAMAKLTNRNRDELIEEAVSRYLDQKEGKLASQTGFKEVLRSWSLEDLDLERESGRDRVDIEFD